MKIGIDIDNVIANTFKDLSPRFNDFMGLKIKPEDITHAMRRDRFKIWQYYLHAWRTKMLTTVSVMEGVHPTLKEWHPQHRIHLVTSRLPLFKRQTKDWLKKHQIPYHELHHAKEKNKHTKIKDCEVFIEDNLEECEVLANHCKQVFLIDHPWNQRKPSKTNIVRVKNWREIRVLLRIFGN